MSTNKTQYLTLSFLKIYKRMKIIIIENVYPKLGIVNGNIGYIKDTSLIDVEWIQKDIIMHPPLNILINFNDFIKKMLVYKPNNWKRP